MPNSNLINWGIYDFYNPEQALEKFKTMGLPVDILRYVKDIINTRIGMFAYNNLPKGLTSQIVETALMFNNHLCMAYIKGLQEWKLCRYMPTSERDEYNKPIKVNLIALNGNSLASNVDYEDIIEVRDNSMNILPIMPVVEFIEKIKKIEDDLFITIDLGTLPAVISGNKKQVSQLNVIADKLGIKKNGAFIVADGSVTESLKTFNINLPFSPLDIYELRNKYMNECMRSLGIYSVDAKRERIVTQELVNQNDFTDFIYQNAKMERELWVKEYNSRTNSNVELVETYDVNYDDNVDEKARLAGEVAEAEAKGELKGNPNINKVKEVKNV